MGWQAPTALASFHHMGCHVHAYEGELHHVLHLHPSVPVLSEAFQVQDENVWERPQAQLYAALLELLTVRASPCVIRSKLSRKESTRFQVLNKALL